jgi:PhnB protein
MPQLHAYLTFDGTCAEAMKFYAEVLGATLDKLITYGQVPGEQQPPPEAAGRIMHAHLVHKDFALMAGDAPPGVPFDGMKGVMLTLSYDKTDDARRVFAAFADGGSVQMPLGETFWVEVFGMVTDRYGTAWGINGGSPKM